jgi:hypothetical protein
MCKYQVTEQLYSSCRYKPLAALEHDLEEQKNTRLSEVEAKVQPSEDCVNMHLGILQSWQMRGTRVLTH